MSTRKKKKKQEEEEAGQGEQDQDVNLDGSPAEPDPKEDEDERVLALQAEYKAGLKMRDDTIASLTKLVAEYTSGGESPAAAEATRTAAMTELTRACRPEQMDAILQEVDNLKLRAAAEAGIAAGGSQSVRQGVELQPH